MPRNNSSTSEGDTMVSTGADGSVVVVNHHRPFGGSSFGLGVIAGVLLVLLFQKLRRARLQRHAEQTASDAPRGDRAQSEMDALARRTATLERIVTDPAHRVAADIDALR